MKSRNVNGEVQLSATRIHAWRTADLFLESELWLIILPDYVIHLLHHDLKMIYQFDDKEMKWFTVRVLVVLENASHAC